MRIHNNIDIMYDEYWLKYHVTWCMSSAYDSHIAITNAVTPIKC